MSADGRYRYMLWRAWQLSGWRLMFVMLNPSTALVADDATIRRCAGFARREGAGGFIVVNLFALRSTDPAALMTASATAIGPENELWVKRATEASRRTIVAWGANEAVRPCDVARLQSVVGRELWCLGTTKSGAPCHPLRLRRDTPAQRWPAS